MATIVYIAHGLRSSLYNTIEFCRRLATDGHDVTVLAFRDVRADVEEAGVEFVLLRDGLDAAAEMTASITRRGRLRSIPLGIRLRRKIVRSLEAQRVVAGLSPDLLLIDAEMHAAILSTWSQEIPTVTVVPFFSLARERGIPPAHTTLRPDPALLQQMRIGRAWAWLLARRLFTRTIGQLGLRALRQRVQPFQLNSPALPNVRSVARFHGLRLRDISSWRYWLDPHVYPNLPMLSFTMRELDFSRDPPANFHHVGPMIADDRFEPLLVAAEAARWATFRDTAIAANAPLVYASMGSMQAGNIEHYRQILGVIERRPSWALVIGLGNQRDPSQLEPIPDNAIVMTYAPQLDVLRHASVAIHSGGVGTLNECVRYEVPSIVCSTMVVDQPGIVARVEHFGLGRRLDLEDMTSDALDRAIAESLGDAETAGRLSAMHIAMQHYHHDHVAIRTVRTYLSDAKES